MRLHSLLCYSLVLFFLVGYSGQVFAQYPGFDDPGSAQGSAGAAGGLVPASESVDGGSIPIGATAQVVIRFRNEGGQPSETGLIRLYPSSNVSASVSLNQCKEEALPSGAECAVALSVKALQPGPWRVEMLMSHNGRTRLVTAKASGTVEAGEGSAEKLKSDIEAIPDALDFGALTSSQTLIEPVILRNITSNEIDLTDIFIDTSESAGYSLKTDCDKLAAGQACIATVTWSPQQKGKTSGVLVVKHSGPTAMSSVSMKGEYTPEDVSAALVFPQAVPGKGLLVASQEEIDFGDTVSTASAVTVALVNSGDAPLTLMDIQVSGSDNGLGFKDSGCLAGTVLQPIEACPLTITWSPTRVGEIQDSIQVLHDGVRGVLVLPVRGTSTGTVSQDQKAILLTDSSRSPGMMLPISGGPPGQSSEEGSPIPPISESDLGAGRSSQYQMPAMVDASGVLDGFKITSFSPTRAIINGPGGSRLVFNNESTVLGGVEWMVMIQKNGIEFVHQAQRVLLLFDRSLSSINRVSASSVGGDTAATGTTPSATTGATGVTNVSAAQSSASGEGSSGGGASAGSGASSGGSE